MRTTSNWPDGVDRGHPNFTLRFPRASRYDGKGGYARNSWRIPKGEALFFMGVGALAAWAVLKLPLIIWG